MGHSPFSYSPHFFESALKECQAVVISSMEPSFFSLLSRKIISTVISIGSLFYSTIPGVNATFDKIDLSLEGDRLLVTTQLHNCYSEALDQIFRSGMTIKIHFSVQVLPVNSLKPVSEITFYHSIHYSLLDDVFDVYRSESQETYQNLNLKTAKDYLAEIEEFPALFMNQLDPDKAYYLRLTAWMDKIQLPGMEEPLNLMFYWNSIKPTGLSRTFNKAVFTQ